jgi:hypothetical protein
MPTGFGKHIQDLTGLLLVLVSRQIVPGTSLWTQGHQLLITLKHYLKFTPIVAWSNPPWNECITAREQRWILIS